MDPRAKTIGTVLLLAFFISHLSGPRSARADERGGAALSLEYQTRSLESTYTANRYKDSLSQLEFHADLFQNTVSRGTLAAAYTLAHTDEGTRAGRSYIGIDRLYLGGTAVLSAAAGNAVFRFTTLMSPSADRSGLFRNPLLAVPTGAPYPAFSNFFQPDLFVRGARADLGFEQGSLSLIGGQSERTGGLTGNLMQKTGASLYGFKGRYPMTDRLELGAGVLSVQDEPSATTSETVRNRLLLLEGRSTVSEYLTLLLHAQHSRHDFLASRPDSGYQLRLGPVYQRDHLRWEANYRRSTPGYLFADAALQVDQGLEGLFGALQRTVSSSASFYGSADISRTNLEHDAALPTHRTTNLMMGSTLFLPRAGHLTATLGYSQVSGESSGSSFHGKTLRTMMDTTWMLKRFVPYGRYRYESLRDSRMDARLTHELTAGLRAYPSNSVYWQSELGERFQSDDQVLIVKQQVYYLPRATGFSLTLQADLELHHPSNPLLPDTVWQISQSLYWNFPGGIQIQLQGSHSVSRSDQAENKTDQILLRISTRLDWGREQPPIGGPEGIDRGSIYGTLFHDANLNGRRDPGETGIPGVAILIDGYAAVTTDRRGRYHISNISPGEHRLDLAVRNVPAQYIPATALPMPVEVAAGRGEERNLTVIEGSAVRGRVVDAETGQGLPELVLLLEPGDAFAITDETGAFAFEDIVPGRYRLAIDPDSLPERAVVGDPDSIEITVAPTATVSDLSFTVRIIPRPVLREIR